VAFTPNKSIGGWGVLSELGGGDFARVYRVEREGVVGALKQCFGDNEAARQRYHIEVDVLKIFSHPGIPGLLSPGEDSESPYFVMEVAQGVPLLTIIQNWARLGRVFGENETLEVVSNLLDTLSYIHQQDYVHRDIKDANVIVDIDARRATLIDFGFCKRTGVSDTRTTDSFWRVGNARFAPPTKIRQPGTSSPSHDVFAIGVIAYRMLTGKYPWSVAETDDYSVLVQSMVETPLVPVETANSNVSSSTSRFIGRLLNLDDSNRPTASSAHDEAVALLGQLGRLPVVMTPNRSFGIRFEHVIRDNVHGDIRLTDYEYRILNSAEMQRLRWIKQLGLTNLVYIGAEHSRLAHSIGTLDRAEAMLRAIEDHSGQRVDDYTRQVTRLVALTHDVCHIAMGHTIEDELGLFERHDKNMPRFERLVDGTSELGRLLESTEVGRVAKQILRPDELASDDDFILQMVSGVAGADVLDYVDRDSLHCGLHHRVDTAIYRQLRLHERAAVDDRKIVFRTGGKFGLRVDRQFAVESLLLERYALFLKVYTHSTKIAADAVLGRALYELSSGSRKALKDEAFDFIGDEGVLTMLLNSRREYVQKLAQRLKARHLPRAVYRGMVLELESSRQNSGYNDAQSLLKNRGYTTAPGRAELEGKIARKSGIDRSRLFFYLPRNAPGYKRAWHWSADHSAEAPIKREPSRGSDIASRHLGLWEAWLFVTDATDAEAAKAASVCQDEIGFENVASKARRPSLF
jgi:HD superfamily phosphohydrolase/predicted Ser/Thr protein kinase